ncbi:MAG: 4-alpha-glucanotransferase [candidate division Zixibacteria bacterium]|nr:4-alpha-glucanotransferase [candidate division Zixibacteria bacterium]
MSGKISRSLLALARSYGVQPVYTDVNGHRQRASTEHLLAILRSLGAPAEGFADVDWALEARRRSEWRQVLQPVHVAWEGQNLTIELRLPVEWAGKNAEYSIATESGENIANALNLSRLPSLSKVEVAGVPHVAKRFTLRSTLPCGYHRLSIKVGRKEFQSLIIAAPRRAFEPEGESSKRMWGVFAPLYALHSARGWGSGDLTDLEALVGWTAEHSGDVVSTLPLLPMLADEPSPYRPVSRLFWNEFYVDVTRLPELAQCPDAQNLVGSADFQHELKQMREARLVDYPRLMAAKRRVMEILASRLFSLPVGRRQIIDNAVTVCPEIDDYARFRANIEARGRHLPPRSQPTSDDSEAARHYHLYAQLVAHEQLSSVARSAKYEGVRLYFDWPLGVHPEGFDVWREPELFARDVAVGAPPDGFFPTGQNWNFPPWRPHSMRQQGYEYFIMSLRHQLQFAKVLRLDHVMGLHRLFWIPPGGTARDGVYVRYPAEEIYAILCLESHRHQAVLVGENLGLVPGYVNRSLRQHRLWETNVAMYDLTADPDATLRRLGERPRSVVCLGTHDMHPFAAFWRDGDIDDRQRLGMIDPEAAQREKTKRRQGRKRLMKYLASRNLLRVKESGQHDRADGPIDVDENEVLRAILAALGASDARLALINLEDLWLETDPQNVPGTTLEHANWQRKTRFAWEKILRMPQVSEALRAMNAARRNGKDQPGPGP